MEFSPKIIIQGLQNDQTCNSIATKMAQIWFHIKYECHSQSENCKLLCPGLYLSEDVEPTHNFTTVVKKLSKKVL